MTEQLHLDWSSAEVSDGKLTVDLTGKPPKEWRASFSRTAVLLGSGDWETKVDTRRGSIRIAGVAPGDEERIRQLLEGAVLEANSTLVSESELFGRGTPEEDEDESESEAEPEADDTGEASRDEQLTERFRAFESEHGGDDDPQQDEE
jgi:hypothetical protein